MDTNNAYSAEANKVTKEACGTAAKKCPASFCGIPSGRYIAIPQYFGKRGNSFPASTKRSKRLKEDNKIPILK